ncbi:sulfatase-like hydrolase/transferase [Halosimplex rubrum]|uniref:Sulfatase-like hydrolase/transferase n=1 Tax=Halosimplex rubrum TaxID=869889 RepID=A0A7D5TMQ1_9EURY|nr:sulfatase-like hydrolase/transferase [Halosimplex rubrum]QLH78452.1 sulfatase-like hydrolase/transferase [Halosimplex rubrum]
MAEDRPNIIFINTDQQRMDTIRALGADHMDTPNLDRLAEEGVTFTDCHITAPSCAPSRASLFTGHYPHTTGIYRNGDRWTRSWVEDLSESGYYTVNVGKMHTAPYETPMGFDERYPVENKDRYLGDMPAGEPPLPGEKFYLDEWDRAMQARGILKQQREFYRQWEDYEERLGAFEWELPEDTHPDVFVGNFATRWLDHMPRLEQPLFMEIGFPGPHPPFDPTPEYAKEYMDRDLPLPTAPESDLENQPEALQALRRHHQGVDHDSVTHDVEASEEELHRQRAYYYANVAMIDEKVGDIMDALEANGYDDTVVVFTSDHGEMLGDHGHIQKWTMYDEVTNVPMMVWSPGRFDADTVDDLVSLFDLGPTMLELADAPVDDSMEAESLVPALEGDEEWSGREYVYAEHARDGILQETEFMTMIRSDDWKLVHFVDSDEGQLFDLTEDPEETDNRWNDPDAQEVKRELLDQLLTWRIRSGVQTADWAADFR